MYEAVHPYPDGESTVARFADTAASVGFEGVVVRGSPDRGPVSERAGGGSDVDLVDGVELAPADPSAASGVVSSVREEHTLVLLRGQTPSLNRFAAEEPKVDVVVDPMGGEGDVNHVVARAAADNGVRFEFNLGTVLRADGGPRVQALRGLRKLRELVEKYDAPYVVSADPRSHLQLRGPRELQAVGEAIGFDREQIRDGLAEWGRLAERNRERFSEAFVAPGVRKGRYEGGDATDDHAEDEGERDGADVDAAGDATGDE